jgi:long-chain fatty acid transport protein
MRQQRVVSLFILAGLLQAGLAAASGFGLFQHGGRATGQVGAFTARGSEPSALTYNPAAITRLPGLQLQAGLDFSNATTDYESSTGSFRAKHIIDFPPAVYVTWKAKESPLAFGVGIDSPFWYKTDWFPALFPNRLLSRDFELTVFELHPVVAWDLGEGWSVGGGLRYDYGGLKQGDNRRLLIVTNTLSGSYEVERNADADVDGFSWDVAVHYADPSWGWGAVFRGPMRLKGNGDVKYTLRDLSTPELERVLADRYAKGSTRQSFEIPRELRTGVWAAPYPELRIEFDVAWQSWSSIDDTAITYDPQPVPELPTVVTRRDWKDTYNLRLGIEGDITDAFALYGGVSYEPSPVPAKNLLPDFPRGDAMVYALGASYSFPKISFDLAYSLHDHDSQRAGLAELGHPGVRGSYSSRDKVWSASVRRRF